jgi:hypothetical protein
MRAATCVANGENCEACCMLSLHCMCVIGIGLTVLWYLRPCLIHDSFLLSLLSALATPARLYVVFSLKPCCVVS